MVPFFPCRSRGSQITGQGKKIILDPPFLHPCKIVTHNHASSIHFISKAASGSILLQQCNYHLNPLSFDFLARDCRQGQLQMHPHDLHNSDVPFSLTHKIVYIKTLLFTFTQSNLYYIVMRARQPTRHIRLEQHFFGCQDLHVSATQTFSFA